MIILDHCYLKGGAPSNSYFVIIYLQDKDLTFDRMISCIKMQPVQYQHNQMGRTCYKLYFNTDAFAFILQLQKTYPMLQINVAVNFKKAWDEFYNDRYNDYNIWLNEIQAIERIRKVCKTKDAISVKNYEGFKLKPYYHQLCLFVMASLVRKCAFFGDMGVGKTLPALHAFAYRYHKKQVKKALVIVPNALRYKWAELPNNEIEKHTHLKGRVVDGDSRERLKIIQDFAADANIQYLITSYNFWSGTKTGKGQNTNDVQFNTIVHSGIDYFICDESHKLKNTDTNVTKNVYKWCRHMPYGIIMTGTPIPNKLIDLYAQYSIIDENIFGSNFYKFFNKYFFQTEMMKYPLFHTPDHEKSYLDAINLKSLTFKAEDCIDLPQKVEERIYVDMTDEYLRSLSNNAETLLAESRNAEVLSFQDIGRNAPMAKLLTASSGFQYDAEKKGVPFKAQPKLEVLIELLENIRYNNKKAIIWYNFRYEVTMITEALNKINMKYIAITSEDSAQDRIRKIQQYESDPYTTALITSPKLTAEGVDIFTAQYSIWYVRDARFDLINQACARNYRLGSKNYHDKVYFVYIIMRGSFDEFIDIGLQRKLSYKDMMFGIVNYLRRAQVVKVQQGSIEKGIMYESVYDGFEKEQEKWKKH